MRTAFFTLLVLIGLMSYLQAQEDKKTDDLKPADPDTGESTVEESTLGLLPNPFEKDGIKFAVTYIGEVLATLREARSGAQFMKTASTLCLM